MIKQVTSSWNFGIKNVTKVEPGDSNLKLAGCGCADYASTMEKPKDHTVVIVIAMGAGESYGPNRNADWFGRDWLKERHNTFCDGHVFLHHKNKDPKKRIGDVYHSDYNDEMDRVELIIGFDNNKVPNVVKDINNGKDIAVSMGTRVPYDVCRICGNKAPTRKHYCDHMQFGGDPGPNQIYYGDEFPENWGRITCVDNPEPSFFDISKVRRPADPTAYMINKLFTDKIASLRSKDNLSDNFFEKVAAAKSSDILKKIDAIARDPEKQKILDSIAKLEGNLPDKVALLFSSDGIGKLADNLSRWGQIVSYPEVYKIAHMALFNKVPSINTLEKLSANQYNILGWVRENPPAHIYLSNNLQLNKYGSSRIIKEARRYKRNTQPSRFTSNNTTKVESGLCALVAGTIYLDKLANEKSLLLGSTSYLKPSLEKLSFVKFHSLENPHKIVKEASFLIGNVIF